MATLQELMAEVLGSPSKEELQKQASAAKPTTQEVDQALENLGLRDSGTVKTASEAGAEPGNGGTISLAQIYEQIMGEAAPAAAAEATTEKTAAAATEPTASEAGDEDASTLFGEMVGDYFNVMAEPFFDKVAADLETEAGAGESPVEGQTTGGSMTAALGKPADPHLHVNHPASSGAPLRVTTKGTSPYSLREAALKKEILRRSAAAPVGNITD